jgi:ribonuclease BN (tRNA processing enzyme)
MSVQDVLKKQQQFINFPVELSGMMAKLNFFEIKENEEIHIGPFKIFTLKVNHPAGTLAYRIESKSSSFSIVTDYEHFSVPDNKLIDFVKESRVLVYDAQFTPEEYPKYVGWGHSTYDEGIKIAQLANIKELHLCHHAPEHDDDFIDKIQKNAQMRFANTFAIQESWEIEI